MQYLQHTSAQAALGYAVGIALAVAVLVGGALPASAVDLGDIDTTATCDGWTLTLTGFPDGEWTVSVWIDDAAIFEGVPFPNGFSLGGDWPGYQEDHSANAYVYLNTVYQGTGYEYAVDCPTWPPPAVDVGASCDGWSLRLDDFDHSAGTWTITVETFGDDPVVNLPFVNGDTLGGGWPIYKEYQVAYVKVYLNGSQEYAFAQDVDGCPTSPPTTTTQAPSPAQPPPASTVAPATTTTVPPSSTTSTLTTTTTTTTTLAPSTTVGGIETEASDPTAVAVADTDLPSGSNTVPLLIGLLAGLALAGVGGGAWYLGKRSAQN